MADDGYAAGAFSIADCAIAGRMWHLHELPIELGAYPKLTRALALATARPAYAAAVGTAHLVGCSAAALSSACAATSARASCRRTSRWRGRRGCPRC